MGREQQVDRRDLWRPGVTGFQAWEMRSGIRPALLKQSSKARIGKALTRQ